MHIHILGICGTFMGGIALLARSRGHTVTGSDANVYPPMSDQLRASGITLMEGYLPEHLAQAPDQVVIGNALSRGNPVVEAVLNRGLAYTSGPQWLAEHVLSDRRVLAVAGTHGKTTASSMLAWILEAAGKSPGFLIGGVPRNFAVSARDGDGDCFVVEADEYDSAFFDKRSKFVHYRPRVVILNNLEYDHADIFPDLSAIQTQFHHLIRTVPGEGLIIHPRNDAALDAVLARGCWTPLQTFGGDGQGWWARLDNETGASFQVYRDRQGLGQVTWDLMGMHNVHNALAAIAAAAHVGVVPEAACRALMEFRNVRRRMELRGTINGIHVYDDFAHHPTAIHSTLEGLRHAHPRARILAILEPRSNTMRMGVHRDTLGQALTPADQAVVLRPADLAWDLDSALETVRGRVRVFPEIEAIIRYVTDLATPDDHIVVMSNGAFGGIHQRLLDALMEKYT